MANLSGLPRSYDRITLAARGLIGASLLALTLGGCLSVEVTRSEDRTASATEAAEAAVLASEAAWQANPSPDPAPVLVDCFDLPDPVADLCARDRMTTNAVIAWSPSVAEIDWRPGDGIRGMPILIKDNIETFDIPTTAGSMALIDNAPGRDAPLVARLRAEGGVILGKANLSEWANIRSSESISGWSAVGGLSRNPYALDRNTCGSSAGSAAAVAAGLAPAAIGTETDGSITCPAAINGIVGFKPTVGLVSRTHIVPISRSQDTAGPMTRTVSDAAVVLTVIAGSDPADPATAEADAHRVDFAAGLDAGALRGQRIGVMRFLTGYSTGTDLVFEENLRALEEAGAILVDITEGPNRGAIGGAEFAVLLTELKVDLNLYLASTDPAQVSTRTLADVIAFNEATPRELALFGQDIFISAEATKGLDDPDYIAARERSFRLAGPEGIDSMMADHDVVVLIAPTTGPAWSIDVVNGDNYLGSASQLAAVAGYPHLTVPMGFVDGLPVGMSFIGGKWQDQQVLSFGYAFEQATQARRDPEFAPSVDRMEAVAPLLRPLE
ncbi:MAG: amidase [Brevundimonas sp.]|uniref:amidase n=1 Tax=Brevundimonas sp. TaxID=1871086 RepID=UPI0030019240